LIYGIFFGHPTIGAGVPLPVKIKSQQHLKVTGTPISIGTNPRKRNIPISGKNSLNFEVSKK
jgi:hypothetical protein